MPGSASFITIACLGMVSFGVVLTTLGASLPVVIERFSIDKTEAGGLLALVSFGVLVGALSFGPIADRRGYKGMLLVAFAAIVIGLEVVAAARTLPVLRIALLVIGVAGGVVNGAVNALVADVSGRDREAALTFVGAFFGVGAAGVPLLLGTLSDALPFSGILAASGALVCVPLIVTARTTFPRSKQPHGFPVAEARRLLGDRVLLLIGAMLFLESGVETLTGGWTPTFFVDELGIPVQRAPLFLAVFWLGLLLGRLVLSVVLRRVSGARVMVASIAGALAGSVLLIASPSATLGAIGVFIMGAGFAATFPVMFGVVGERFAQLSGTALGIVMAMALSGGMLLPYVTGVIASLSGLRVAFAVVPVSLILLGGLVVRLAARLWPARVQNVCMGRQPRNE